MQRVILFDLDGTLLPIDTAQFIDKYLQVLSHYVAPHLDPQLFLNALLGAVENMIHNLDPQETNEQVFTRSFLQLTRLEKESIWPVFDRFYSQVFPSLADLAEPSPWAKKVVEEALAQDYRLAVATNPVFPRQAILHRLAWAGVGESPFELITTYEETPFTKPHQQYYQWICDQLQVEPQDCIMVGNDMQEDMVASLLGMKTFLVEGHLIDRGEPQYHVHDRGSLTDLYHKLKERDGLFTG